MTLNLIVVPRGSYKKILIQNITKLRKIYKHKLRLLHENYFWKAQLLIAALRILLEYGVHFPFLFFSVYGVNSPFLFFSVVRYHHGWVYTFFQWRWFGGYSELGKYDGEY